MPTLLHHFQDLFHWADELAAVMTERKRDDLVQQINEAKDALAANNFTLAVLGKAKRGKSTLINALLGRKDDTLAPIDKLPASSAITRFRFGDTDSASVLYQNGRKESIPYSHIKEFVTEESNPGNRKEVAMLEVTGQFPHLPPQVELVDTPGAASIHEHHDALLHAFIPQADAVIFLVTARMPLDQDELDLLKEVKKNDIDKIFFVINKIDETEPGDLADAEEHNRKLLAQCGISPEGFHKISAKNAFLGQPNSNVPELNDNINQFLAQHKGAIMRQRFLNKINSIVEAELRTIEVSYASGKKTGVELDADIVNFQREKKELTNKREYQENEFKRKWNSAVDHLKAQLSTIENDIIVETKTKIDKTWSFGVGKLVKTLPTMLNQLLAEHLDPLTNQFEESTRKACEELREEYPILLIDDAKKTFFAKGKDMTVAKAIAISTVSAVGGASIASAGAATAGVIAATNTAAMTAFSAASTTAASTAGIAGLVTSSIGAVIDTVSVAWLGIPTVGAIAAPAPVLAAPTLMTTPLWVALAGPVGWTLAGVGVIAVPFAWRLSKLKQKDKLEAEAEKQIKEIFHGIRENRISHLQTMGDSILNSFRNNLNYKIRQLEDALNEAKTNRPSPEQLAVMQRQCETTQRLMGQCLAWLNPSA